MSYDRKIRRLRNIIKKLEARCVGFSVLSDGSVVYAVNGDEKAESKTLSNHGKDIEKILGAGSKHSNISYSFSYFTSFSRRDLFCKKYEDYFYSSLDYFGQTDFFYFSFSKKEAYAANLNNTGNFNCVERKLIGYSVFDELYVSFPPCYFCLAAIPFESRINYIHYRNNKLSTFVRHGNTFYKLK